MNILDYFPFDSFRAGQDSVLSKLESNWDRYDVFVVRAPTGFGKSPTARAIQDWRLADGKGCIILTPNNLLRDQYLSDFEELVTVRSQDDYWLKQYNMTERDFRQKIYKFGPKGSEYERDRRAVRLAGSSAVVNYHTYLSHKLYRDTVIVDEAHSLLGTLQTMAARTIWRHIHGYPMMAATLNEVREWLEPRRNHNGLYAKLWRETASLDGGTALQFGQDYYRGEPKPCLKLMPINVANEPPVFWPSRVRKLVLMSATIGPKDIEYMGLGTRRVIYIDVPSPIDAAQRPIHLVGVHNMSAASQDANLEAMATTLLELAEKQPGKGFVHCTYDLAAKLKPWLNTHDRFIFHTRENKAEVYEKFYSAHPNGGKIMVGSGMYEGLDLKYDVARWQAMVKCPYPNLGNASNRWLLEHDPDYYNWQTSKDIMQACGRICRAEDDEGHTFLLDSSFKTWYSKAIDLPAWFNDAMEVA